MSVSIPSRYSLLTLILTAAVFMAIDFQYKISRNSSLPQQEYLVIGERRWYLLERAATDAARRQGLAGQESLPRGFGMLFEFDTLAYHSFWMRGMSFPLDVVFIRGDTVDSIVSRREPGDLRPIQPNQAVDRVLEVNAGEAEGIRAGDKVQIIKE